MVHYGFTTSVLGMKKLLIIVWKDIVTELRTKELLSSMFMLALLILVIFNFALGYSPVLVGEAAPAILWISFIFAGVLGLTRTFAIEKEGNAMVGMLLTPTDRTVIYLAKLLSSSIFVFIVGLFTLPLFALFFNFSLLSVIPQLILIIFLGTIGFVSVGTLFSAMVINTRLREILLPIVIFPIIIPVVVSAVKLSAAVISGNGLNSEAFSLKLLLAFDIIFLAASAVVFEYVIDES